MRSIILLVLVQYRFSRTLNSNILHFRERTLSQQSIIIMKSSVIQRIYYIFRVFLQVRVHCRRLVVQRQRYLRQQLIYFCWSFTFPRPIIILLFMMVNYFSNWANKHYAKYRSLFWSYSYVTACTAIVSFLIILCSENCENFDSNSYGRKQTKKKKPFNNKKLKYFR